jgi:hypothetical protein
MRNRYIALIPAYEPGQTLTGLTEELKEKGFPKIMEIMKTYGANDKQKRDLVKVLLFKK